MESIRQSCYNCRHASPTYYSSRRQMKNPAQNRYSLFRRGYDLIPPSPFYTRCPHCNAINDENSLVCISCYRSLDEQLRDEYNHTEVHCR